METQMNFMEALTYFKGLMDAVIKEGDNAAVKAVDYANNKLKLYLNADKSDATPIEIDLPEEMFLDQAKTKLVGSFAWSETEYPGSTNPNLDGKPVMVLAVKGDTDVTYSFVSFESLTTDISSAKVTTKEAIDALFA